MAVDHMVRQPWRLLYDLAKVSISHAIRFDQSLQKECWVPIDDLVEQFVRHLRARHRTFHERVQQYDELCHYNPTFRHPIFKAALVRVHEFYCGDPELGREMGGTEKKKLEN